MYRRYYSVGDMPQIPKKEKCEETKEIEKVHTKKSNQNQSDKKLFSNLETDDIILIAIALLLLADDCDDKMLLIAIGLIFISGII